MGYKQIDGNKLLLVNEHGQFRYELRNLPPDSDRFIYHYDRQNNKMNRWPKVIVSSDEEQGQDERWVPEVVMKEHGALPKELKCSEEDFVAIDGDYMNPDISNIKYVGDGSFKASKPFADKPTDTDKSPEENNALPADGPGQPEPDIEPEVKAESTTDPEEDPPATDEGIEPLPTSKDMKATEAVEHIEANDFGELDDLGFYTEDERDRVRVTVKEAWEKAEKEYKESLTG